MIRCDHGFRASICAVPSCPHYAPPPAWEQTKRVRDRKRHKEYRARRAAKQEATK